MEKEIIFNFHLIGLSVILFLLGLPFALMQYDKIFNKHKACDWFGWHNGCGSEVKFDGCSFSGTCSKCGKKVLEDSQGNWFTVRR